MSLKNCRRFQHIHFLLYTLLVKSFTGNTFSSILVFRENKVFSHQYQLSVGSNLFKSLIAASNSDLAAGYFSAEAEDASFQQRSRSLLSQPHHLN